MKLFLAFVVCFVSMVDLSLAITCIVCGSPTACSSPLPEGSGTFESCKVEITITAATTATTIVRSGVATGSTCASSATDFATGVASKLTLCTTGSNSNGDTYSANLIGCYTCSDLTPACLDPATKQGVKSYDNTGKESGKSCSVVATYKAGILTSLVRSKVTTSDTTACANTDTSASGDGVKSICSNSKDLSNDAVFVLPITTVKPTVAATVAATGAAKHAPKNIMNAFVLISAVILAVVSK